DDTLTIAVTVQDVNEAAPAFSAGNDQQAVNVDENSQTVGTYAATDADATATQTYSIVSTNDDANSVDAAIFSINQNTGALTFTNAPNYENPGCGSGDNSNSCKVILKVSDGDANNDDTITVNVNVQDVGLDITSGQTGSITESADNGDAVMTVEVTGDTGGGIFITINGGNGDGIFAVSNAGALTIASNTNLDYDTTSQYTLTLVASDLNSQFDLQTVTINIIDVNDEQPVFTSSATPSINENVRNVVTLTSTDADSGDSATYAVRTAAQDGNSADAALFEVNNGVLRFTAEAGANYESAADAGGNNEYVVVVRATDNGGNTRDQTVTITINDVNEFAPAFDAGNDQQAVNVDENSQAVGTYAASDSDGSATQTYSIVSTNDDANSVDAALFSINSGSGALTFTNAPNREAMTCGAQSNSHVCTVIIKVTDGNSDNDDTLTIAVTVQDVNEAAPAFSAGNDQQAVNVDENSQAV
ncbi:MAG: cadherin domain-containing protein, partial [Actinomycetota bacterium]|nr:cadherin domain-containing protein [Actinomycetota bacterium]